MSAALRQERRKRILRPTLHRSLDGKDIPPPRHRPAIIRQTPPRKLPTPPLRPPDLPAPMQPWIPTWISSINLVTLSVAERMYLRAKSKRSPLKRPPGIKLLNLGGSPQMRSSAVGVLDSWLLFRPNVEPGFVTKGSTSPSFSHVVLRKHSLSIHSCIVMNYLILRGNLVQFRNLIDEAHLSRNWRR